MTWQQELWREETGEMMTCNVCNVDDINVVLQRQTYAMCRAQVTRLIVRRSSASPFSIFDNVPLKITEDKKHYQMHYHQFINSLQAVKTM